MSIHFEYLNQLGMVVNKSKTELMFMKNKKVSFPTEISIENEKIIVHTTMKVLGVQFDHDMSWTSHVETLTKNSLRMISGLKVIRRSLSQDDIMKVITSQYFGRLYYAIAVWHSSLTVKLQNKIEILHYKALRIAIRDYERLFPREMLDLLERQKPKIIDKYMTGSIYINCYLSGKPTRLLATIKENEYLIRRTGQLRYFDSSKKRIGKQALCNRIDEVVKIFDTSWTNLKNKDAIRIFLKKTFFRQDCDNNL